MNHFNMRVLYVIMIIFQAIKMCPAQLSNNTNVNCTFYKESFGNSVSRFTSCAISNSRPIKLCEACIDTYIDVLDNHRNLTLAIDTEGPCINKYIHLDRLEIMETLYANSYDLWNRAKCYECFVIDNGVLTRNGSEETIKFNELYSDTSICINANYNATDLCNKCLEQYLKLSDFYNSISNENDRIGVCMDIVDMMNRTRSFWSEKCCRYRHHSEYVFIASTVCMCIITILFYILTKAYIDKKSPAVFLQSRFAESLSHNS